MKKLKILLLAAAVLGSVAATPRAEAYSRILAAPVVRQFYGVFSIALPNLVAINAFPGARVHLVTANASGAGTIGYCSYSGGCFTLPTVPAPFLHTYVFNGYNQIVDYGNFDKQLQVTGNVYLDSVTVQLVW